MILSLGSPKASRTRGWRPGALSEVIRSSRSWAASSMPPRCRSTSIAEPCGKAGRSASTCPSTSGASSRAAKPTATAAASRASIDWSTAHRSGRGTSPSRDWGSFGTFTPLIFGRSAASRYRGRPALGHASDTHAAARHAGVRTESPRRVSPGTGCGARGWARRQPRAVGDERGVPESGCASSRNRRPHRTTASRMRARRRAARPTRYRPSRTASSCDRRPAICTLVIGMSTALPPRPRLCIG